MKPQHACMSRAKLVVWAKLDVDPDVVDDAEEELRGRGLISNCVEHDDCVLLADIVAGARA